MRRLTFNLPNSSSSSSSHPSHLLSSPRPYYNLVSRKKRWRTTNPRLYISIFTDMPGLCKPWPVQAQARESRDLRTQDQQTHRHSCNGLVLHCSSPDHRRPRLSSAAYMATLVAIGNAKHCPRPVPLALRVSDGK